MNASLLREDRLMIWDRLIRGERIPPAQSQEIVSRLAHDASSEEKAGSVLLLASVGLANEGSRAMRRNLRAALRYWFSHTGTKDRPEHLNPRDLQDAGLDRVIGLYLNWPEAMKSVGGNGENYSALKQLERQLRARCADEWQRQFGSSAPSEMSARR